MLKLCIIDLLSLAKLNLEFRIKKQVNEMEIGKKIKALRTQKGLTHEELADRAELSKGFISQVERDLTSPSIATLIDILQCLGTDLKTFFNDSEDTQIVFRKGDFFEKTDAELKNTIEWIIPNAQKNCMEPIHLLLEKGGETCPDNPHEGEEFGYVLKGKVEIHLGKRICMAQKGDAFYYKADKTHYLKGIERTELIWVTSPPSF